MSTGNGLPVGWVKSRLAEVSEVLDSRRSPINSEERQKRIAGKSQDKLFPYFGATGQVGYIDDFLLDGEFVLLGEDGAPFLEPFRNKAYLVKGKIWVNNHAHILRAFASNKFLCHYLNQVNYRDFVTGTTRLKLNQSRMNEIPVLLPPLPEQHRIVEKIEALFSELENGIEQLKTAQQQLKVYRQSVLKWAFEGKLTEEWRASQKSKGKTQNAVELLERIKQKREAQAKASGNPPNRRRAGKLKPITPLTEKELDVLPELPEGWAWVKLGEHSFVTKLAGFEFTKYVKYKEEGEIPVIRAQNVSKEGFIPRNFIFVDRSIMEHLSRSRVYGGEILMVFVGAGLGNVGVVPEKTEYFLGPNVAKIAPEKQFSNKYILHFLSSVLGFANVSGMSKATAQGSISMANIREVIVPLTSLEEQHQIVQEIESRLSVCDKLEETITASLQQSEALRQSILKKAFEGKLVPQDPRDEPASVLPEKIRTEKQNNPGQARRADMSVDRPRKRKPRTPKE